MRSVEIFKKLSWIDLIHMHKAFFQILVSVWIAALLKNIPVGVLIRALINVLFFQQFIEKL